MLMNKIKSVVRRVVALVAMLWLVGSMNAIAASVDPSYAPGAPDNPRMKQTTEYRGNVVNGGASALPEDPKAVTKEIDRVTHQDKSDRPKTTGEWNREKAEDAPLSKRVKQIGKESKEAFKDFGKVYPDTAERSTDALKDQS
jgi:hypothetical protein